MSERWKHQLKMGIVFGLVAGFFTTLFELRDSSLTEQMEDWTIPIRFGVYILVGVFLLGYVSWKSNQKKNPIR